MSSNNLLSWLEDFYSNHCNGDWEHQYGLQIETIDNPGWSVTIDLVETRFEHRLFNRVEINRTEQDWIACWSIDGHWEGMGGSKNLQEILGIFKEWVEDL